MASPIIHIDKKAIAFRDEAINIEKEAANLYYSKRSEIIYIDFASVIFISRSFADEWLDTITRLTNSGITVKLQNVADNVQKMLKIVTTTRAEISKLTSEQIQSLKSK